VQTRVAARLAREGRRRGSIPRPAVWGRFGVSGSRQSLQQDGVLVLDAISLRKPARRLRCLVLLQGRKTAPRSASLRQKDRQTHVSLPSRTGFARRQRAGDIIAVAKACARASCRQPAMVPISIIKTSLAGPQPTSLFKI
jgi:hypothetical protein